MPGKITVIRPNRCYPYWIVCEDQATVYDFIETDEEAQAIAAVLRMGLGGDAWEWCEEKKEKGDYMRDRLIDRGVIKGERTGEPRWNG